jgi:hypothetical protein
MEDFFKIFEVEKDLNRNKYPGAGRGLEKDAISSDGNYQ